LSLWLATLARDHEFTFLDHALKCGDSLVGLTTPQIAAVNWDESKPGLPLFRQLVKDGVAEAMRGRSEIQGAPDDTTRAIQEARHRSLEERLKPVRVMGDAVISALFAADKPKAREKARAEVESLVTGSLSADWGKLDAAAARLREGAHPITPFHWQVSFRRCSRVRMAASMQSREIRHFWVGEASPVKMGSHIATGFCRRTSRRRAVLIWFRTSSDGAMR